MTTVVEPPALPAGMPALDPTLPLGVALLETSVLLVQQDRLRALTLGRVADVETRQLHELDGSPSIGAWSLSSTRA